jgi:carbon-monoxide dehydrogenase large subunit
VAGSILGNRVLRREDPKFLTTGGVYVDDLTEPALENAAHVTYVRSPLAHGKIVSIDTSGALEMPGVLGVYTAADLGLEPAAGPFNPMVKRGLLAIDKVRFVGEPVAVVVTELANQGEDAAEAVIVEYDALPALVDLEEAMTSSTLIYDEAGSNVVFDSTALGMPDLTGDEFFADCEVKVTARYVNQRIAACPLEVRGSSVAWVDGRLHQWLSTQGAQSARDTIKAANGLTDEQIRVITPDVGGGFGAKISCYAEEAMLGLVAKKVDRPLRWRETRSENMMAMGHGRAQVQYVTIGGNRDGKVTHYRLHVIQDSGGFAEMGTILAPFMTRRCPRPSTTSRTSSAARRASSRTRRPRRRTAAPAAPRRLLRRSGRWTCSRRDRDGSRRGAAQEPHLEVRGGAHHGDRPGVRRR